ncbi:hypothetical protein D3C87_1197170 [compost metagenome]
MQAGIGRRTGVGAIDTGLYIILDGLLAEQALALDIGAQANRAQRFHQAHRNVAFANGGNTVGNGHEARRNGAVAFRQVRIGTVLAQGGGALHRGGVGRHAEQRDLGANQCTVGFIEVEQLQALIIAGQFQILADEATRQALQAAIFKVHGEETGIGIHVGETERFVELDAVENHDVTVDHRRVTQMNVAVAFTDETVGLALGEYRLQAIEAALCPGLQGVELQQVSLVAEEWTDLIEVLAHRCHDAVRGAGFVFARYFRCIEVEPGNLRRHRIDVRGGQFAIGLQGAEQAALWELAHFQQVFDGRAFAAQLRSVDSACDWQHFKIQIICQALVQTQLFAAKMLASLKGGEVKKAEINRLLHFIGIGAGEQHPGNMGLYDLKPVNWMRKKGRVLQGGDQGLAHRVILQSLENSGRHYGG